MKIYTKKGDSGETSILGSQRYSKADLRICAIGEIDELNAYIGLSYAGIKSHKDILQKIQSDLFIIGAQLAVEVKGKYKIPELSSKDIEILEKGIDEMEASLNPMTHFILPVGDLTTGYLHVSRAVCRRAERTLAAFNKIAAVESPILMYINRLSDFLFVLSRYHCKTQGIEEIKWVPEKG
ncbi:MAG TPA: cob(I)yrinic acid a,c-diamide adenosyltransferase [Cytophagales bacterium]|nr:cob(I)yrinic acid a,c-diamide adenosyltransferase [Cytophagales bacterium]